VAYFNSDALWRRADWPLRLNEQYSWVKKYYLGINYAACYVAVLDCRFADILQDGDTFGVD
jgi:hypothetical protein